MPPSSDTSSGSKWRPSSQSSNRSKNGTRKATLPPNPDAPAVRSATPPPSSLRKSGSKGASSRGQGLLTRLWRTTKSVYYASSPAWRFLKSGALFLFGLFCWSAANLLLSYEPDWQWPYFFMAYGFLLVPVGPLTHLVLVPHLLPWLRRRPRDSWLHLFGQHLTLTILTVFFGAVMWMGLFPPSFMQMDFRAAAGVAGSDVNPSLFCSSPDGRDGPDVTCRLEQTAGVGAVSVESGGTRLLKTEESPYTFSLQRDNLVEVVGQHQFQVVVYDEDGRPVRRFNRTISMTE